MKLMITISTPSMEAPIAQITEVTEQKDNLISFLWNMILGLGAALTVMGGYIFHRFEKAVQALEEKICHLEKKIAQSELKNSERFAEIETNIAVILEQLKPLHKMAQDIHAIKNDNTIKIHVLERIDAIEQKVKRQTKKLKKNVGK